MLRSSKASAAGGAVVLAERLGPEALPSQVTKAGVGLLGSMGLIGNCYDNSMARSAIRPPAA
jgi:hypothetical protein